MGGSEFADGGTALLDTLARLPNLVELCLYDVNVGWPDPCAAYSSLIGSKLQTLSIENSCTPAAAWEDSVFAPPGRGLPALAELHFRYRDHTLQMDQSFLNSGALSGLARSCSEGLRVLNIAVRADASLTALRRLTQLTSLELVVDTPSLFVMRDAAECVAAVSSLKTLSLELSPTDCSASDAATALFPLVGLRQLTRCVVQVNDVDDDQWEKCLVFFEAMSEVGFDCGALGCALGGPGLHFILQ